MASGINTTFRQVGIATGIAALGSVFAAAMQRNLTASLAHVPGLAGSAPRVLAMVRQGQSGVLLAHLPTAARGPASAAIRSGFAAGLNDLMIVTGAVALVGAVCATLLIRAEQAPAQSPVRPANVPADVPMAPSARCARAADREL
jgi:hypothetical protein